VTVISGMARGVDQAAHKTALKQPGSTIGVLGTGLDTAYPRGSGALHSHIAEQGLLLSEFAPGTPPAPSNFPVRNRIISGLSLGTLVIEAAPKSGSLITARLALEQNRSVYAVPGALGADTALGCQNLIRQGARPVFTASDILSDLFPHLRASLDSADPPTTQEKKTRAKPRRSKKREANQAQNDTEERIFDLLTKTRRPLTLDELLEGMLDAASDVKFTPGDISALMVSLEMRGLVRRAPGQTYGL
jgi:DNA processing protein